MIGKKVKHKMLGTGIVTEQSDTYIAVQFVTKKSKFVYPEAFETFLTAIDSDVQANIMQEIEAAKRETLAKKAAEEAAKREAEARRQAEEAAKRAELVKKYSYTPKPAPRAQRTDGKRLVFFVFQGSTFNKEYTGGYMWAPISTKSGSEPHHWSRLLDVRRGDVILHGCDGYVQAISIARDACYECPQPGELEVEDLWEHNGRKVDCDYTYIKNPIKTAAFVNDILRLGHAKYSPFNRDGAGNMGYLFEINRELARIFVRESVKQNPYLGAVDYIDEFLREENDD